jgi:hypothetical protein
VVGRVAEVAVPETIVDKLPGSAVTVYELGVFAVGSMVHESVIVFVPNATNRIFESTLELVDLMTVPERSPSKDPLFATI